MLSDRPTGRTGRGLEQTELRAKIVALAKEGHSQRAIASIVGFASHAAVHKHLEAYRAELTPSQELAEQWRQDRLARADARFKRLGPLALADPPDYAALSALQREEESITKMLGANLEIGVSIGINMTAEGLAAALGYDEPAIDVQATEIES